MSVAAPRSKDELTAEWLTSILREEGMLGGEGTVAEVRVEDVGVGRDYICQTVRVTPTYAEAADGAPPSLVAKVPTLLDFPDWLLPFLGGVVETEHNWYREEEVDCPGRTPACYGTVFEKRDAHAILLEDCSDLQQFSQVESCSAEVAGLSVEHLARLHAYGGRRIGCATRTGCRRSRRASR